MHLRPQNSKTYLANVYTLGKGNSGFIQQHALKISKSAVIMEHFYDGIGVEAAKPTAGKVSR